MSFEFLKENIEILNIDDGINSILNILVYFSKSRTVIHTIIRRGKVFIDLWSFITKIVQWKIAIFCKHNRCSIQAEIIPRFI